MWWWRFRSFMVLTIAVAGCSTATLSGPRGEAGGEDDYVRALGEWEVESAGLPADSIAGPVIESNGEFFGVALMSVVRRSGDDMNRCMDESGVETATVAFMKLGRDGFVPHQSIALVDEWVDVDDEPLVSLDVTEDGVNEVVVMSNCNAQPRLSALRLVDWSWSRLDLPGATSIANGGLIGFQEDCLPSCVDSGVVWTSYRWDGQGIVPAGLVTSDGQPVSLKVEMGCAEFVVATALPIQQCSEGPLVRKFLALASASVGDYGPDASISHTVNRFDERVATWVLTYRYSHGLQIAKAIDGEMFAQLGLYWNPQTPDQESLFDSYCVRRSEDGYGCAGFAYLMPTELCPRYRSGWNATWPLQLCDFDGWVDQLLSALSTFDGDRSWLGADVALFDSGVEQRVMNFQRAVGLEVDGYVGRNTWRALAMLDGSPLTISELEFYDLNGDGLWGPGDSLGE